ncbi:MAG: transglycosylase domain-containing protein, partial [Clostridiales bacterium]|nr:transglycosylase domain-containing protein [Clostridiales bacterium]
MDADNGNSKQDAKAGRGAGQPDIPINGAAGAGNGGRAAGTGAGASNGNGARAAGASAGAGSGNSTRAAGAGASASNGNGARAAGAGAGASNGSGARAAGAGASASKPTRPPKPKKPQKRRILGRLFTMLFLICVILGFVGVGLVGGYVYNVIDSLPDLDLKILSGELTTYVYDRNDDQIAVFHSEKDRVPLDPMDIPLRMKQAIVAIEDQRFFRHKGIDPIRIGGAFRENIRSGGISQGASTITMQVVRLVVLEVSNADKSYDRKIQEAWLAYQLEQIYSKEQILAFYLNNVYYGQRAYSCATAAMNYFNKDLRSLTLGEYAFLAGVVNGPGVFNPFTNMERAKNRQAIVLNEMVKMDYITEEEAKAAKDAPLNVVRAATAQVEDQDHANQSFLDYTFNEACDILGIDKNNAIRIYTGGYRIYTTLDVVTQAKAEELYADDENFPVV